MESGRHLILTLRVCLPTQFNIVNALYGQAGYEENDLLNGFNRTDRYGFMG